MKLRLRDGSEPSDWSPGPGDAPCDARAHDGHSRNGCPDLFTGP